MNILVTGASGQLGQTLQNYVKEHNITIHKFYFTTRKELDISQCFIAKDYVVDNNIDVIINCAAYTDVKKAQNEVLEAFNLNAFAPSMLPLQYMFNTKAKLIHISTDFVFDGEKKEPYTVNDKPYPINAYGWSKYLGELYLSSQGLEQDTMIIRVSWLFSPHGKNFFNTVKNLVTNDKTMSVVNDQIGCPTYTYDLAELLINIIDNYEDSHLWKNGLYQFTNNGNCSWYEFAKEIAKYYGKEDKILPTTTEEYGDPVKRPKYSVMENNIKKTRSWKDAVKDCYEKSIKNN